MATSSIHIQTGHSGYFAHNSRETPTKNSIFHDEQNFCSCSLRQSFEIFSKEIEQRAKAYTQRTKQKLQKNTVTHLSAIINLNQKHTEKDLQKVCKYLEEKFDTKVVQFAIHRDEGHIDTSTNQPIKNYHAHVEFVGLDSNGNSIRKKLDKKNLIQLQTEVANILAMDRGQKFSKSKRLDTYEFKRAMKLKEFEQKKQLEKQKEFKQENQEVKKELAELKNVKELNTQLREELKATQIATQKDYQILKAQIQELEIKVKAKDLTIDELQSFKAQKENEIEQLKNQLEEQKKSTDFYQTVFQHSDKKTKQLEKKLEEKEYIFREYQQKITGLEGVESEQKKELHKLNSEINNLKKTNQSYEEKLQNLETKIAELNTKNTELEKDIKDKTNTISILQNENNNLYKKVQELQTKQADEVSQNIQKTMHDLEQKLRIASTNTQSNSTDLAYAIVQRNIKKEVLEVKKGFLKSEEVEIQTIKSPLQMVEEIQKVIQNAHQIEVERDTVKAESEYKETKIQKLEAEVKNLHSLESLEMPLKLQEEVEAYKTLTQELKMQQRAKKSEIEGYKRQEAELEEELDLPKDPNFSFFERVKKVIIDLKDRIQGLLSQNFDLKKELEELKTQKTQEFEYTPEPTRAKTKIEKIEDFKKDMLESNKKMNDIIENLLKPDKTIDLQELSKKMKQEQQSSDYGYTR